MQVIVALSKSKARRMLAFALESQLQVEVTEVGSGGEAIERLLRKPDVNLVICEYPSTTTTLFQFLAAIKKKIPCLVYLAQEPADQTPFADQNIVGLVRGSQFVEEIQRQCAEFKVKLQEEGETIDASEFCRIGVELLRGLNPVNADLYIRLAADKFVKLFQKGDFFDNQDRQKFLVEKKIEYLHVKRADSQLLLEKFREDLNRLVANPPVDTEEMVKISAVVYETVADLISRFGVTSQVQEAIKTTISATIKTMGKSPRLKTILAKLTGEQQSYISKHSIFMAQLSCSVAAAMDWGSESTFQKLTTVSFLHDITLTNQTLARAQTREDLKALAGKFSSDQIKEYLLHPAQTASIARQFIQALPDVDVIIVQHHERPDGSGFPRGLNHRQISPLSCVFIVAHDLMSMMYEKGADFDIENFIEKFKNVYNIGTFRRVLMALRDLKVG